jgi:Tol biopolymer transport system component
LVPENRATAAAISADGKRAAYANADGIFVRSIQSGETRQLLSPDHYVADSLSWFADDRGLVASGFSTLTNIPAIWFISGNGAPPHLLRSAARAAAPSPDGARIAFTSEDASEIWVMGANGEQPRQVVARHANNTFSLLFWSPDGRRLGVQDRIHSSGRDTWGVGMERFYEKRYESIDLASGRVLASAKNLQLNSASWLSDGRLLFLGWDALAGDFIECLWQVKTDPRTGAFLAPPAKIASPVTEPETDITGMTATRDGKLVMVLKQSDQNTVFTGDFDASAPRITNIRRLTLDERTSYPHAWTHDSRAVIFESIRRGTWDIFKQDVNQRTAVPIVATPAYEVLPQISPDGRWVLYACSNPSRTASQLMRVPLDGGTPEDVPIGGPLDEFHCALGSGKRCVLRISVRDQYRAFYDLDPIRGKGRELTRTQWLPAAPGDWDVSPDGKYIAISKHDPQGPRIRVLALEPRPNELPERELALPGFAELNDAIWSADGKGWFVSLNAPAGNRLLYVYLDGRFRPLGDIQGWAVPSPDGRRVAFLDRMIATNAWMIDQR